MIFYPLYDFRILVQIYLSIRRGLADTKIDSQVAVKVLELTEKWKYPNFRGKF